MKTAKMRDVDGGIYWIAFFDDEVAGKRVSYIAGIGDTEKDAINDLVAKEKVKATKTIINKRTGKPVTRKEVAARFE